MKKIIKVAFIFLSFVLVSCSSNDAIETNSENSSEPTIAMVTKIDGVDYNTPPQIGGNLAENSGGTSFGGSSYYLLKGYKNLANGKMNFRVGNKIFNIYLAIPKSDISVGNHNFSSTFNTGDYYADVDISGVVPSETVTTTSGFIKIISNDLSTKLIKGSFTFTTNDGVDLLGTSHIFVGSFTYKLP